jgi:hypothetical protein
MVCVTVEGLEVENLWESSEGSDGDLAEKNIELSIEMEGIDRTYTFTVENCGNDNMTGKFSFLLDQKTADAVYGFLDYCRKIRNESP